MLIAQLQPSCLYGEVRPPVGRFVRVELALVSLLGVWETAHLVVRITSPTPRNLFAFSPYQIQ